MTENLKRRWQFSLRTLLLVVTLAAFPCAWVGYSLNWVKERREFLDRRGLGIETSSPSDVSPPFCLWIFGERPVDAIYCAEHEVAKEARRLFPESVVHLEVETAPTFRDPTIHEATRVDTIPPKPN